MTGNELAAWRKSRGMTQTGLGQRIYMSADAVSLMERRGDKHIEPGHEMVVAMASMYLATDHDKDGSVLTDTALRLFAAISHKITPAVLARLDFSGVWIESPQEMAAVASFEAMIGRTLDGGDRHAYVLQLRAAAADYSTGQVGLLEEVQPHTRPGQI